MIFYRGNETDDPFYPVYSHMDWLHPEIKVRAFPLIVDIEMTNHCNFRCAFCSRKYMTRKPGHMDWEHAEKIANEAAQHGAAIRIHGWGEPLMHPQIVQYISLLSDLHVLSKIYTNASLLTAEMAKELFRAGLGELTCSMQGLTADGYASMRIGQNYTKYIQNVTRAAAIRDEIKSDTFLSVNTSIFAEEKKVPQIEEFREFWFRHVDKVTIDMTHLTFLDEYEDTSQYSNQYLFEMQHKPCVDILIKAHVSAQGNHLVCGNDVNSQYQKIGNLDDISIHTAWHSKKMTDHRKLVYVDCKHLSHPLCQHCYDVTDKYEHLKSKG